MDQHVLTKNLTIQTSCMNMLRNNIKNNNLNITFIMDKPSIPKGIIFDKILINTYRRCMSLMNYEVANTLLHLDNILNYNSTYDNYIAIDPQEYKYTSIPTFSDSDNEILSLFYGVTYLLFIKL